MFVSFNKNANHKYCSEDFTSHFRADKFGYMILSDGCSSSNGDVIFGTRLFHKFIRVKTRLTLNAISDIEVPEWMFSGLHGYVKQHMNVDDFEQDALFTCLSAAFDESRNYVQVNFIGDGYLFVEDFDGNTNILRFEYENNTPMYVSYLTNDLFGMDIKMIKHGECDICIDDSVCSASYFAKFKYTDIKKLFLFSDGVEQIGNITANDFIDAICKDEKANYQDHGFLNRKAKHILKKSTLGDDVSFVGYIADESRQTNNI